MTLAASVWWRVCGVAILTREKTTTVLGSEEEERKEGRTVLVS